MALAPISGPDDWEQEIRDAAIEEFDAEITIRELGEPGAYDPITGTRGEGTPGAVLISGRIGRAQQLGRPVEYTDAAGRQTKLTYRIQIDAHDGDPSITEGLVCKVVGGRDPELEKMTFHVAFATNSTHMAVRTVMCSTEGGRQ